MRDLFSQLEPIREIVLLKENKEFGEERRRRREKRDRRAGFVSEKSQTESKYIWESVAQFLFAQQDQAEYMEIQINTGDLGLGA